MKSLKMMEAMKIFQAVILTAAFALVAWVGPLQSAVSAQEAISGELTILGFGLGDEIATERVAHFQEMYPDVTLNFTEGALDEQQFLTAVVSGNPPDIVYLGRGGLSTYAVRGALMPLTDCIAEQEIDMSQYREVAVSEVTVNDEVYGIPEFYNNIMLIINTAALDEAGLTLDDIDTSDWEALSGLNDQLTRMDGDDVTRIGFDPKLPEFFPLWVEANGGSLLSEDGRTAQLNTPEAIEALEFSAGLHEAAGGRADFVAFRDTWDFFGAENQVVADQIAFWPMEQWYMNVLAGVSADAPVAFKAFSDREGNPLSYATGGAWAIPNGSGNPAAACAMMKEATSPEAWTRAAQTRADLRAESGAINTGVYTGNVLADEEIFSNIVKPIENEAFQGGVDTILSVQESAFGIPANPAGAEFQQEWQDAVNRVLNGEQTAEEALNQAQEAAQAALDEAWASQQ